MKYKVLLIDDEPSALEAMQLWIDWQELGFEVCGTSSNGKEGLELMKQLEPDLVITDVNMPLMNGLEMVAAWQQAEIKEIKFAILSGYSEFEYAKTAIHYGINHYLMKPVFPEEAAEELLEIYQELEQEAQKRSLNQIASAEEAVSLLKGMLHEKAEQSNQEVLNRLSKGKNHWNICLIQTEPVLYTEIREQASALLTDKDSMFLMDLESHCFGIVYGYNSLSTEGAVIDQIATPLLNEHPKQALYIATGAGVGSLLQIGNSFRMAKEALMYYFYFSENVEILTYQEIKDSPFSYHYDQIQLMDDLIRPINTLDSAGFSQAVNSAARSFREQRIAPEVVKKIVIHMMYKIIEFTSEASEVHESSLSNQIRIPAMLDSMITLTDLMRNLLFCGEASIDTLLKEQNLKSQGIVQEINNYIEEHFRECLTIKRLSEVFFLHPVYLGQLLIKKNGINFNEQLHNLRIKEAVHLLQQNKLKNSEIAEKVGYGNYSQFLKQFEKKLHMSPNEFKNTNT
ncbi:DNA-binding response regulator [Paenibacillus odorifer]|uniref:response regulator transcription factor n=1 Tax=Paenibacillus odorifer TaxID=189426 RepID=UPI00096BD8E5|nr:response regulator [Paenibacillus odorifer]OMD97637.1 DNA-binding response regulator [Paenibacillus odorifer]